MKKHKSVVAILLAVMMIFAMMPAMAFAAVTDAAGAIWADDFSKVTVKHSDGTSAEYSLIKKTPQADGSVRVEIDVDKYSTAPADTAVAYYVDMTGAKLGYVVEGTPKAMPAVFTSFSDFAAIKAGTATAAYAIKKADGTFYDYKAANVDGVWTATVTGGEAIEESKDDQTATLSFKKTWTEGATEAGTAENPFVIGEPESVTVTIKGTPETAANIDFYYDTVKAANKWADNEVVIPYDGASHKIVTNEVAGLTVSYKVYDSGKWTDASEVSVKDVADSKTVRYTIKKADGTAVAGYSDKTLKITVEGLEAAPVFGFTTTGYGTGNAAYEAVYKYEGSEYDKAEHFDIAAPSGRASKQLAAAVAANKADLQKFFNDYFQIDATAGKFSPDFVNLSISVKEGLFDDAKTKAALDKQYKGLIDNFGIDADTENGLLDLVADNDNVVSTAIALLNDVALDYEVEFTQAPVGAKVYHVKKAKSLKKAKSFTVKAASGVGAEVYYKLVDANSKIKINKKTGKITLKKGLKKGTYTFKVKAYVPDHAREADGWFEYQTIKVKIKK